LTLTVHELLAGIEAPVGDPKVKDVVPAPGAQVGVPPHVVVAAGVAATCSPEGSGSVNVTPVNAMEFEFARVNVNVEVPLTAMGLGEKAFVIAGGFGIAQPVNVTLSTNISEPEAVLPALKKYMRTYIVLAVGVNEKLPNDEKAIVPVGKAVALLYRAALGSGLFTVPEE
jgi:hypothetical protein